MGKKARKTKAVKPSEVTDTYWISADRKHGSYPDNNDNAGKWLIFVKLEHIDEVWEKIKNATEQGALGSRTKVSTMKPNPFAKNPNEKVICVYTYDWTDESDVKRIRTKLRELGITNKIPYKANEDTFAGRYAIKGNTGISKYYE